jgi:hypothetical protein
MVVVNRYRFLPFVTAGGAFDRPRPDAYAIRLPINIVGGVGVGAGDRG